MRTLRRFGFVPQQIVLDGVDETSWPFDIDKLASDQRIHHYHRLLNCEEAAQFLSRTEKPGLGIGVPIQVDAEVNEAWYSPPDGKVAVTPTTTTIEGVHSFSVVSYAPDQEHPRSFLFQNSWGEEWGDQGWGYLTRAAYERYVLAGWTMDGCGYTPPIEDSSGINCLLWKAIPDGQDFRGVHGREIVDCDSGQRIAWAFARSGAKYLELEEFVVWPSERGKAYGRVLASLVKELADEVGKPIRAWVPYADAERENETALRAAMHLLDLHLHPCGSRAASYLGLASPTDSALPAPFLPPRATSTRDVLKPRQSFENWATASKPYDTGRVLKVWYGTNRRPNDAGSDLSVYSSERGKEVYYGTVDVAIPRSHRFGSIGSPWYRRWLTWTDDRIQVIKCEVQARGTFWNGLNDELRANPGDSLVYLHGFNVDFNEAAVRAAQMGADLKVAGEIAFFSWPSRGTIPGYPVDEASIDASESAIAEFLTDFVSAASPNRVHIVAHSMGNRGFVRALQRIANRVTGSTVKLFGQFILAAPDLDADLFGSLAEVYGDFSERTTLYASPADKAVSLSRWLHGYPRAGLTPPITVANGIDTIVVPGFDLISMGHSYYAEAAGVLHDIYDVMRHGTPPAERQRLSRVTDDSIAYWEMLS